MSIDLIRVLIVIGSTLGGMTGAFVAVTKLVPERANLILGYQVIAIENLQKENERLRESVARLEKRLGELEAH